jgi:class 3 adenylate cyclase
VIRFSIDVLSKCLAICLVVTVADVDGFTEWSIGREPCQVFTLLETLYAAFDQIAEQRRIYKVETVGTLLAFPTLYAVIYHILTI